MNEERRLVRGGGAPTDATPDASKTSTGKERKVFLPDEIFPDWLSMKKAVQDEFINRMNTGEIKYEDYSEKRKFNDFVNDIFDQTPSLQLPLDISKREQLFEFLYRDFYGMGGLEPYLDNPTTEDIVLNKFDEMYVYVGGEVTRGKSPFKSDAEVIDFISRLYAAQGKEINRSNPAEDATLPDGSRIIALIPPIVPAPAFVIRKHNIRNYTEKEYLKMDMFPPEFLDDLKYWVRENQTLVLSGATGSGKTTFLNFVSSLISAKDRLCIVENIKELQIQGKNVLYMQALQRGARQGRGDEAAIQIRDLVYYSLRLRPDRIIVGECRGTEAFDMLQAVNTGHEGSMTTLHANSPADAIKRLETMAIGAEEGMPMIAIQDLISSGVDVIIQVQRFAGQAKRSVTSAMQVVHPMQIDPDTLPAGTKKIREMIYLVPLWEWSKKENRLVRKNSLVEPEEL